MKTPREILLARHQAVEPKLDSLREQTLAKLTKPVNEERSMVRQFIESCRNYFHVPRLAWSGLAAAWFVIIALNAASSDTPRASGAVASVPTKRSPEMLQALREQKRLFAELVGTASEETVKAPHLMPRPRSERPSEIALA